MDERSELYPQRIQALTSLIQVSQALHMAQNLEEVLDRVLEAGGAAPGERAGAVILLDETTHTLRIVASQGIAAETVAAFPDPAREGAYAEAIRTGRIVELPDGDPLRGNGAAGAPRITHVVPLRIGQRVIGLLALDTLPADDQGREWLQALADVAAGAVQKTWLLEQAQREARESQRLAHLVRDQLHKSARLYEISTRLHVAHDLEPLLHSATTGIAQVFAAAAVEITLFDATGKLDLRVATGLPDDVLQETTPRPGGSVHTIWRTGQPLIVSDTNLAPTMIHPRLRQAGFRALLGLPLPGRERILGVIRFLFDQPQPMLWDQVDTVAVYVNQIAVAIENVRLYHRLEDLLMETIRALVHTFEAKDQYSARHSEEVMRYAVALARELGFDEARCRVIQFGALLHDIGKIGVGDQILLKGSVLDTNEWFLMRTHPTLGAEIVRGIRPLRDVVDMVRHHHERFDGMGYPDGLAGHAIPLEARILAVVDAFESMTSDRAYRRALSVDEALERLEAGADRQWDGRIVKVWCDLVRREGQKLLGVKWDLLVKEKPPRSRPVTVHHPSMAERSSTAHLPGEEIESGPENVPRRMTILDNTRARR